MATWARRAWPTTWLVARFPPQACRCVNTDSGFFIEIFNRFPSLLYFHSVIGFTLLDFDVPSLIECQLTSSNIAYYLELNQLANNGDNSVHLFASNNAKACDPFRLISSLLLSLSTIPPSLYLSLFIAHFLPPSELTAQTQAISAALTQASTALSGPTIVNHIPATLPPGITMCIEFLAFAHLKIMFSLLLITSIAARPSP